jgi:pimeloyl-ACP methyl ester carboxylesterase
MIRSFEVPLAGGVTLACRTSAAPVPQRAPRVMFVHGFPEAAFAWDEVISALDGQARCWAPQLRGYAGSYAPPELAAYRARHLVADLAGLIEAMGAPLDLLVAHDWGGAVAWSLAAQRPQLLRQLLIINSPHAATFLRELKCNAAQQQASAYMNFFCRPDAEALLAQEDFARLWPFFGEAAWLNDELRQRYRETWQGGLTGALNYYRASPLRPPLSAEDAIHQVVLDDAAVTVPVPTHVLWGERDRALLPALLEGLERWVPALTVQRVPEASHWIVHEQPELVVATVHHLLRS